MTSGTVLSTTLDSIFSVSRDEDHLHTWIANPQDRRSHRLEGFARDADACRRGDHHARLASGQEMHRAAEH